MDLAFKRKTTQTLYEEIKAENGTCFNCLICSRRLSRLQRIESHLKLVHGRVNVRTRKYKKYIDDPTFPIPKSTRYDHINRLQQSSQASTSSPALPSLFPGDNFQHHDLSTSEFSTHLSEVAVDTNVMEDFDGMESNIMQENFTEAFYEIELPVPEETTEIPIGIIHDNSDMSADSDSDSDVEVSSSDSSEELDDSDADDHSLDSPDESESNVSKEKTFSAQENACMAILALISRHCMTAEAAKDILDLLKLICPENVTVQSLSYTNVQQVCGNCEIFIYDICERCLALFPKDRDDQVICSTEGCDGLRYKGGLNQQGKKLHKNSFVSVNIFNQLRYLLERDGTWKAIEDRSKQRGKSIITDIIDGENYKRLCEAGQFLNNPANISFIFNTDGAPLYSSSSVSLWPVFLAVNELPSPDRFSKRNMILWGIWQGKGKPPFNTFFEPFTSEMSKLYNKGITVKLPKVETPLKVRVAVLLGATDLQGKAYLTNMTQHNGESGCITCEEPGVIVAQGNGHTRCYPYKSSLEKAPSRTTKTLLEQALRASQTQKRVAGMIDVTSLANMPWFDIVLGMVPDYMHGCLLGITKTLLKKWFSSTNYKKDFFIGGQIKQINKRVLQMRPPDMLSRLPRDLEKHFKNLKASELQSWLLYYALPCVVGYLPDKYLQHFACFSEAIYLLLGNALTPNQLGRAQDLLDKFYMDFQALYGAGSCGLNVHNAGAHLVDYVKGWGPLWAWSTFGFEDMNGTLMDFCHGTGNVCRQLIWMLHAQSTLINQVEVMPAGASKDFILRMLVTKRGLKNLKEAKSCQIAGAAKKLSGLPPQLMRVVLNECGQNTSKVSRIVKKGQIYFSREYTRMVKRNACVVLLSNGKVADIQFFTWNKESGVTLVVYKEIEPDLDKPFFFDNAGCHILRMKPQREELQLAQVEDIVEKVVFLEGNCSNPCIVRLPNFEGVCG